MAKTLTKYKFFIYVIFYLFSIYFFADYKYKLLYPLLILLLIFCFEFKKDNFYEEKFNIDLQFLLNLFDSIFFSLSIYILLYCIGVFFSYDSYEKVVLDFSIINLVIVTILYPIFEEFFFRKLFVMSYYRKSKLLRLVLLNGFIFSISHIFSDTPLLNAFLFGCCFSLIYLKNKKIMFSILSHMFINSLLFLTYYCQEDIVEFVRQHIVFIFSISFTTTVLFFNFYLRIALKETNNN